MADYVNRVGVQLGVDSWQYEQGMAKAAKATSKVDTAEKSLEKQSLKTQLAMAAVAGAVTLVGAKMSVILKESVNVASMLSDSSDKMETVFGKAATQVEDFAKTSLTMSKRAAYDATSTLGQLGKAAGLAGNDLAKFSVEMVGLSGDLAAFWNTTPEQALGAVAQALRGQYAALGQYGVLLNDATLRQRAFEMQLISTETQALTPQQKVLAAQAEIMAQTVDAQGALEKSSGTLAYAQKEFAAASEDAKAALGEALLPAMTEATEAGAGMLRAFTDLPKPIQQTATALAALTAVGATTLPFIAGLAQAIKFLPASLLALGSTASAIVAPLVALGGAIAGVYTSAQWQRGKGVDALVEQMNDAGTASTALYNVLSQTLGGGEVVEGVDELFDALANGSDRIKGQLVPAFEALDSYLANLSPGRAADAFDLVATAAEQAGIPLEDLNEMLPEYTAKSGEATDADLARADALTSLAAVQERVTAAIKETTSAYLSSIDAALAAADTKQGLVELEGDLREGMYSTTKAAKSTAKERTAASEAERESVQSTIDALRKRDAAEVKAEIEAARRRAKRRAEARADAQARRDLREGVAEAIATDKAARRGEDIEGKNQTGSVGEYSGTLTDKESDNLKKREDQIRARHRKALDAQVEGLRATVKANTDARNATVKAAEAQVTYNNSLKAGTIAGEHNRAELRSRMDLIVAAGEDAYNETFKLTDSIEAANRAQGEAMLAAREDFLESAKNAGYARDEVRKYLAEIELAKQDIYTTFHLKYDTTDAERKLKSIKTKLDNILDTENNHAYTPPTIVVPRQARMAGGGEVYGPGSRTSDSVPIWASKGEYIVNAAQYAANRELVRAINAGGGKVAAGGMTIGAVNVTESGSRVRASVIDALAESAYRNGAVR